MLQGGKGGKWKCGRKKKEVIRSLKECRAHENARGLRFNRTHWEFQVGDVCLSIATEKCPWQLAWKGGAPPKRAYELLLTET